MAARYDAHTAVRLIAAVEREPRRHAGAGLHPQIELILVQRLPPRTRRFEVEHRLHRVGLTA